MSFRTFLVLLITFALLTGASADPQADFKAANEAASAKQYERALTLYRKILEEAPSNSVFWNAGMCAYLSGDGATAAEFWRSLKNAEPLDYRVREKLIQAYELAADEQAMEKERSELLELHQKQPELFEKPYFCRDQFQVGEVQVMAYEVYEMQGERKIRYTFYILNSTGQIDHRISLGSYDQTNAISHELGETPEGVRLFHLDGYYEGGRRHRTFSFFQGEPSYQSIKKQVIKIVDGKAKALSESLKSPESE